MIILFDTENDRLNVFLFFTGLQLIPSYDKIAVSCLQKPLIKQNGLLIPEPLERSMVAIVCVPSYCNFQITFSDK